MFANPDVFLLLILIPLFMIFFIWRSIIRASALRRIGDIELIQSLLSRISPARRRWKSFLWLCALAALIAAVARPVWGFETELVRTQGVQVVLALDISRSMDAEDIPPSRLQRMQFDMLDLVGRLAGNDVGIVLFAGEAFVYMPLTYDTKAAEIFLNNLSTDTTSIQGTNLEAAIQVSLALFETRTNAQPVIILASDGENHEVDPEAAAQMAAENNVIIYSIGYGTESGGLIPLYDSLGNLINYKADDSNQLITSVLNAEVLERVATITGGFYQQASTGGVIANIVDNLKGLETGELREELITRPIERFGVFVALALFALSLEILLPETQGRI